MCSANGFPSIKSLTRSVVVVSVEEMEDQLVAVKVEDQVIAMKVEDQVAAENPLEAEVEVQVGLEEAAPMVADLGEVEEDHQVEVEDRAEAGDQTEVAAVTLTQHPPQRIIRVP